jgi:hypothetical protein
MSGATLRSAFCATVMLASQTAAAAGDVSLRLADFSEVAFDGVRKTIYANEGDALVANVRESSSILVHGLDRPIPVRHVAFEWRSTGQIRATDATQEESKAGDDAILRIGLILAGKAPMLPFMAPTWVKAVRDSLKLSSDRMMFLIPHSRHQPGARWESPYSGSIECIAVGAEPGVDGWLQSRVDWPTPVSVVGYWIMADGDDTMATFTTKVRHLHVD